MQIKIHHEILYSYQVPVVLDPQVLRFYPRAGGGVLVTRFNLDIHPSPDGYYQGLDIEGNIIHEVYFSKHIEKLDIKADTMLDIVDKSPFSFIIYPFEANNISSIYTEEEKILLASYKKILTTDQDIKKHVAQTIKKSSGQVMPFIVSTAVWVQRNLKQVRREEGTPLSPEKTFRGREGACRDLAVLLMAMYREAGLAARFVSGYCFDEQHEGIFELHAWTEVYIPNGGWVGFDPTSGLAVTNRYVVVAASAVPERTVPVSGNFWGRCDAKMYYNIVLKSESAEPHRIS